VAKAKDVPLPALRVISLPHNNDVFVKEKGVAFVPLG
jgi:hypothetical protein